ncbi:MAG: DUF1501 domain-containing protein [Polyangiaceae bacterium]
MHRRDFLTLAGSTFLQGLLARAAFAAPSEGAPAATRSATAQSVILLWMNGGPSHLDTWDPKPGAKTGGPTKSIKTRLPGLEIAADMPRIADVADRLCVVRSVSSKEGNHQRAQYLGHTSYAPNPTVEHPSFGAWIAKKLGPTAAGLPAFVSLGGPSIGPGFFGAPFGPFIVQKPGGAPENTIASVDDERFARRLSLLSGIESRFGARASSRMVSDRRTIYEAANRFMRSPDLAAFDLSSESDAQKAAYGDSDFGRGCLVAKRLVRAGVRFVEVTLDGWDTHQDNFGRVKKQLDVLDPALAALLTDLGRERGADGRPLLATTLVVCMGDFGRTPRINANDGRDHYPQAWSAVLAGAGIAPGVIGATDAAGEKVVGKTVGVADLVATAASLMGLSPSEEVTSPIGRPIAVTDSGVALAAALSEPAHGR